MLDRSRTLLKACSVFVFDWLRFQLQCGGEWYLTVRNRMEKLGKGPYGTGYVCLWPYTSRLTAVEFWPVTARWLLKSFLMRYNFIEANSFPFVHACDISVLIGHRGLERLPLLLATLKSLASQENVSLECIVIEQDVESKIRDCLPRWVRYLHQKSDAGNDKYNRSAAFNYGVRHARGPIILLHDNDMLVPTSYCHDIKDIVSRGYQALNIKRYVFYLGESDTAKVLSSFHELSHCTPEYVLQNLEAGGSMAITRKAYLEVGGMDEDFVGWGGEDNEFWNRCSTLDRWIWGYLPVIHLWHESQPLKLNTNNTNVLRAKTLESIPVDQRIAMLRQANNLLCDAMNDKYDD